MHHQKNEITCAERLDVDVSLLLNYIFNKSNQPNIHQYTMETVEAQQLKDEASNAG